MAALDDSEVLFQLKYFYDLQEGLSPFWPKNKSNLRVERRKF